MLFVRTQASRSPTLCEWCQELQVQGLSLEKVNTVTSAEMEHLACLSKFQQLWLPTEGQRRIPADLDPEGRVP